MRARDPEQYRDGRPTGRGPEHHRRADAREPGYLYVAPGVTELACAADAGAAMLVAKVMPAQVLLETIRRVAHTHGEVVILQ